MRKRGEPTLGEMETESERKLSRLLAYASATATPIKERILALREIDRMTGTNFTARLLAMYEGDAIH